MLVGFLSWVRETTFDFKINPTNFIQGLKLKNFEVTFQRLESKFQLQNGKVSLTGASGKMSEVLFNKVTLVPKPNKLVAFATVGHSFKSCHYQDIYGQNLLYQE